MGGHVGTGVGPDLVGPRLAQGRTGAVQPGRQHDGQTAEGQHRHGHHLGQFLEQVLLGDDQTERPPDQTETDDDPDHRRPAAPGHEGRQPDLATAFGPPPLLLARVGLPPDQRGAGAGERHRPEQLLAQPQPARLHHPQQPGAQGSQRDQRPPVDPPLRLVPGPQPGAARRLQPGRGALRLGRQQQPERPVRDRPEELDQQQPDEADPDHHHRPPEMPRQPRADAAEDRPLRDPPGPRPEPASPSDPDPASEVRVGTRGTLGSGPDGGRAGRARATRAPKPVVNMCTTASHSRARQTSGSPPNAPSKAATAVHRPLPVPVRGR